MIGKISKILPGEVTIQFKGKASNAKVLHDDDNLKRIKSSNLSSQLGNGYGQHTRSERTVEINGKKMLVEHIQQQLEYIAPERKNETRALRRLFCAKRVKRDSKNQTNLMKNQKKISSTREFNQSYTVQRTRMKLNVLWPSERTQERQ